ncbi:hypothetical protein GCM10011578_092920 [Streptomyces fuscichromogenes]|uniref:Uncharacterized protein n=1 Tax=Streptomyces fuscichromogenes TaxID=1324013 RepID=A0A917XNR4_9ACTN|nr:hypothetical protein GCM10011578_092920 [Streptomyces fuscichromogenes]
MAVPGPGRRETTHPGSTPGSGILAGPATGAHAHGPAAVITPTRSRGAQRYGTASAGKPGGSAAVTAGSAAGGRWSGGERGGGPREAPRAPAVCGKEAVRRTPDPRPPQSPAREKYVPVGSGAPVHDSVVGGG